MTAYEIRPGKVAPCELVSIVHKNGTQYVNFIAEGTHTHCMNIKNAIEGKSPNA